MIAGNSFSQEKNFFFKGYISPGISFSQNQNTVHTDGQLTSADLSKSMIFNFGLGIELLKRIKNDWLIGADIGFIGKGYFERNDITYSGGSISGTTYTRYDMNFFETTLFIEKQIQMKNPSYKLLIDGGLFYGTHILNLVSFGIEANGNDFGTSLSAGIQRKKVFVKLDFDKGLITIKNNANAFFKTNVLSFKIGYSIF